MRVIPEALLPLTFREIPPCVSVIIPCRSPPVYSNTFAHMLQFIISLGYGRWALEALLIASVIPTRKVSVV